MNLDVGIAIKFLIKHMINNNDDFYYMNEALKEAYKAYRADEVPVGCVIVNNGKIIARAHNKRQKNIMFLDMLKCWLLKRLLKNYILGF